MLLLYIVCLLFENFKITTKINKFSLEITEEKEVTFILRLLFIGSSFAHLYNYLPKLF